MSSSTLGVLLYEARHLLQTSSDQIIAHLSERVAAFEKQALQQSQAEAAALQSEIAILRTQLADTQNTNGTATSGGTGDMPLRETANSTVKGPPTMTPIAAPAGNADVMTVYDEEDDTSRPGSPAPRHRAVEDVHDNEMPEDVSREESSGRMGKTLSSSKRPAKRASVTQGGAGADAGKKKKAVFADASQMKEQIRLAVLKKEYNVMDFYKETGWPQKVARSTPFDFTTLGVIAFNALWIMVDTDYNDADTLLDAHPVFQIAEHFFCAYFTAEWTIRFLSFEVKRNGLKDGWFCFDTCLVTMMVLETWVLTLVLFLVTGGSGSVGLDTSVLKMVRLVRLTRMARMARLLRALPELLILIKGIVVASRSVMFTLGLLLIVTYIFAIVFVQLVSTESLVDEIYFGTVPRSMLSLILDGVLPDQAQIVRDTGDEHMGLGFLVLVYILLASLTVMNMLIGVLCEVVSVVAASEKEQLTVTYVKSQLKEMFQGIDDNENASVSKEEFSALLVRQDAAKIIQEIGVDVIGLVDYADYIFKDEDMELSFPDFMDLILQLRGSNTASVKDIVDLRRVILDETKTLANLMKMEGDEAWKKIDVLKKNAEKNHAKQLADVTPILIPAPNAQPVVTSVVEEGPGLALIQQDYYVGSRPMSADNAWAGPDPRGRAPNNDGSKQRPATSGAAYRPHAQGSPMPRNRPNTANALRSPAPPVTLPNRLHDDLETDIVPDQVVRPFWLSQQYC